MSAQKNKEGEHGKQSSLGHGKPELNNEGKVEMRWTMNDGPMNRWTDLRGGEVFRRNTSSL
ncbi:hypothetical protein ACFSVN_08715 [Gracilimonas halophila]|uniref:Uncharacterized protein n=1 Tax=Gracilimonas halophila TaxID=1834464 RepID=A0ABW5JLB5_9BACT